LKPSSSIVRTALLLAASALALTGCETGRTTKLHGEYLMLNDVSARPTPHHEALQAIGIPPVPGSPTGAGSDGYQPLSDSAARQSPGAEEGKAAAPRTAWSNGFVRQ
jgi:hypothetical protein